MAPRGSTVARVLRRAVAGWIGLATCLAGPLADESANLKKWIDGPVRYLARRDEVKMFRSLESNEARAIFVEKFWRRRDPTPGTLGNEYRELFWRRVKEANDSFNDSSKPGWMTDRGKIWILYGPPTDIENYDDMQSGRTTGRGVIRWIYQGRPGERMDLDPVTVVAFQRDTGGEYRVSYDPNLTSVFFDETRIGQGGTDRFANFFETVGTATRSELSVMLDLGKMQEVPPADQVLLEQVETFEAYRTQPLAVDVNRYFRPEDGRPLAVVNIDLGEMGADEKPAIVARFVPQDSSLPTRVLGEESFKIAELGTYRVAQGRLALDPGDYTLTVIAADPVTAKTGLHHTTVDVPEPPKTLRLSDPVWAVMVEPVPYATLSSYDEPFHLGPFRVLPKTGSTYRRGESINLFVEAFGASYPLRAVFQLQGRESDGSWVDLGQPAAIDQTAGELAWEIPTGENWPAGGYRVRVEVTDAEGRLVQTTAELTLE